MSRRAYAEKGDIAETEDIWEEKKELTKLVFGPILTPPLGELIAEGDKLKEKAERWDQYAIYDNDNEPKILVKDLITAYETLKVVNEWVKNELVMGPVNPPWYTKRIRQLADKLETKAENQ